MIPFKVQHETKGDVPHAMGMVVELLDKKGNTALRIGYTGDTAYFKDLHEHLEKCHILIAHISQPSIEELQDATKFKEAHLALSRHGTALERVQAKTRAYRRILGRFYGPANFPGQRTASALRSECGSARRAGDACSSAVTGNRMHEMRETNSVFRNKSCATRK